MMLYPFNDDRVAPVIVTNKHVIEKSDEIVIQLPGLNPSKKLQNIVPTSSALYHPDSETDICLLPIAREFIDNTVEHKAEFISSKDIYNVDRLNELTALENIVMIGYPNGLIDISDMFPITRQGITATPVFANFNGKTDFLIDCACFPGSSGSPVYLFDRGVFADKSNNVSLGQTRFGLLGLLYAGPILNQEGRIMSQPPPDKIEGMVEVPLMMNLGTRVKAIRILEMLPMLRSLSTPPPSPQP